MYFCHPDGQLSSREWSFSIISWFVLISQMRSWETGPNSLPHCTTLGYFLVVLWTLELSNCFTRRKQVAHDYNVFVTYQLAKFNHINQFLYPGSIKVRLTDTRKGNFSMDTWQDTANRDETKRFRDNRFLTWKLEKVTVDQCRQRNWREQIETRKCFASAFEIKAMFVLLGYFCVVMGLKLISLLKNGKEIRNTDAEHAKMQKINWKTMKTASQRMSKWQNERNELFWKGQVAPRQESV